MTEQERPRTEADERHLRLGDVWDAIEALQPDPKASVDEYNGFVTCRGLARQAVAGLDWLDPAAARTEGRQQAVHDLPEVMTRLADGERSKWHDEVLSNGAGESWVCVPIGDVLDALGVAGLNASESAPAPYEPESYMGGAKDMLLIERLDASESGQPPEASDD